jgi:hypothetical protein
MLLVYTYYMIRMLVPVTSKDSQPLTFEGLYILMYAFGILGY